MNVAAIRAELAEALSAVVVSVASNRGVLLDGLPGAVVEIDTITPATFGDGAYDVDCTIRVLVSKADDPDAWYRMDDLLSGNVIRDALEGCGIVQSVGAYDNVGADIEYDDGVALGFTIAVTVLA